MTDDQLLARLAAANPVPTGAPAHAPAPVLLHPRRALLVAAVALAVCAPAAAFADDIGRLFGFSNGGTAVPTSSVSLLQDTKLREAMEELGYPSTLQLLGEREGISFYIAQRPDGSPCFAVDSDAGKGVGCVLGGPPFPSPDRPIVDFSSFSHGARLAGFAADGVARVELVGETGAAIASAAVVDNIYADADVPPGAVAVRALDTQGNILYQRSFGEAP